ncbi:c-type cytochrome [Paraburkholderia adhaesiva]|uniref:c-type cytochrome n=1 Tax=Paraburkholderia adhaesiva TaxID=2883244 RepID=UPI001F2C5B0C|nr:cytochrome c [Paraburkholderia adhaesiva]
MTARSHAAHRLARCAVVLFAAFVVSTTPARGAPPADAGEAIYQRGIAGSGEPVEAMHDGAVRMHGAEAACVNCHRRSGLGAREGNNLIPPVTGEYLTHARTRDPDAGEGSNASDIPFIDGMRTARDPYTDATLARAIREGVDPNGRQLGYLMPQFALNDADMAALIAYLKRLDHGRAPGVADTTLHFATIITPDADPVKRRGMLAVLEQYVADKNATPLGATPALRSSRKMMFMVNRRWELHVWELHGPPSTWQAQLADDMARQPVFAILSGLGGSNWAPVHDFCEAQRVPCLFPNVEVPVTSPGDFYSLYFSKGVLLEAELIAQRIADAAREPPDTTHHTATRVRQIYRKGDSGEAASEALAAALKGKPFEVANVALAPGESVAHALRGVAAGDVLVLWLRPNDLEALRGSPPPPRVFVSGLMGGLDRAPLPDRWRDVASLAYPVDLPDGRRVRVDYAFGWFAIRHIPVVDERVQVDTWLACGLLAETLSHLVDAFVRDYLVERVNDMLEHRVLTGFYPRLSLATGQHYASKGGYIVRFSQPDSPRVVADGPWTVPQSTFP